MSILIVWRTPQAENPNASHAGLGVTAGNLVAGLIAAGHDARAVPVIDGYMLQAGLRAARWGSPSWVVMCAPFFDNGFLSCLVAEFPGINFVTNYHSHVPFLACDGWASRMLTEQLAVQAMHANYHVSGNSKKFVATIEQATGSGVLYLPNIYQIPDGPRFRHNRDDGRLRIGAFGASRLMKNLPSAAWASGIIHQATMHPVDFVINSGREEGPGSVNIHKILTGICTACDISLIIQPWAGWEEFRVSLRSMDLLLQPSFSESFNNVTADGVWAGVASVVGPAIDWVPASWHAEPELPTDIARVARRLLADPHAAQAGAEALRMFNAGAIAAWHTVIG